MGGWINRRTDGLYKRRSFIELIILYSMGAHFYFSYNNERNLFEEINEF